MTDLATTTTTAIENAQFDARRAQEVLAIICEQMPQGMSLNLEQRAAVKAVLKWVATPAHYADPDSCAGNFYGRAGSGKSFTARFIIEALVALGYCERHQILAIAPTHAAVANIRKSTNVEGKTVHSFLRLCMKTVKMSATEKREYKTLKAAMATAVSVPEADAERFRALEHKITLVEERAKELRPTVAVTKFHEEVEIPRVIVFDEAPMTNESIIYALREYLIFNEAVECPKILCLGDLAQLPPVGERLGKVAEFQTLATLAQVVRQDGVLLDYVSTILDLEDPAEIAVSHQQYLSECRQTGSEEMVRMSEADIIGNWRDVVAEVGIDNLRVLTTSNARVRDLNRRLYRATYPERPEDCPYETSDRVLTLGPIMRDPNFPKAPGASEGIILFPTSTVLCVSKAERNMRVCYTPTGRAIRVAEVEARPLEGSTEHRITLCHPLDTVAWREEVQYAYQATRTLRSRGKGRGQKGDAAKAVWKIYGLKNWEKCISKPKDIYEEQRVQMTWDRWRKWSQGRVNLTWDKDISQAAFSNFMKLMYRDYHSVRQLADNTSLTFCSTTHRAQGQTIPVVVVDLQRYLFNPSRRRDPNSTWDHLKTIYTAVSRVGRVGDVDPQLVLMY